MTHCAFLLLTIGDTMESKLSHDINVEDKKSLKLHMTTYLDDYCRESKA
jgi:hypothetical protein